MCENMKFISSIVCIDYQIYDKYSYFQIWKHYIIFPNMKTLHYISKYENTTLYFQIWKHYILSNNSIYAKLIPISALIEGWFSSTGHNNIE